MRWSVSHHTRLLWVQQASRHLPFAPRLAPNVTSFAYLGEDLMALLLQHKVNPGALEVGYHWACTLLDEIQSMSEVTGLRAVIDHDPLFAGVGTRAIVSALADALPSSADRIPVESDCLAELALAQEEAVTGSTIATIGLANDPSAVIRRLESASKRYDALVAAEMPILRNAVREAVSAARSEIDLIEEVEGVLGGGCGRGRSTNGTPDEDASRLALAKRIQTNDRLKRIMELAGRFCLAAANVQATKSVHALDEVVGQELGQRLPDVAPDEIHNAFSNDSEMVALFYSRYVEAGLTQSKRSGTEALDKGDVVALVDTSGSMAGTCEEWAKATVLALWSICRAQRRNLLVMDYDTSPRVVLDARVGEPVEESVLMSWLLRSSSGGGTVVSTALDAALDHVESGKYERADVLLINDGDLYYSEQWLADYELRRRRLGARVLGIGVFCSTGLLDPLCDATAHVTNLADDGFAEVAFDV